MLMADSSKPPRTFERLDALSRIRPLTELEAARLERAVHNRREHVPDRWSKADLLRLRRHLLNGKKPAQIGILMRRTERAIWRMMNRMGWTVKEAQLWVLNPTEPIAWSAGDNFARSNRRGKTVQSPGGGK